MISVEKALKIILAKFKPLGLEKTHILHVGGRIIGEDIFASRHIPSAANSAMDGYAVHSSEVQGATSRNPVKLKIIEDLPAGKIATKKINKGEAARIMTGAIIPKGANAVVRQEDTRKEGRMVIIFPPSLPEKTSVLPAKTYARVNESSKRVRSFDLRISECSPRWANRRSTFIENHRWPLCRPGMNWSIFRQIFLREKLSIATAIPWRHRSSIAARSLSCSELSGIKNGFGGKIQTGINRRCDNLFRWGLGG